MEIIRENLVVQLKAIRRSQAESEMYPTKLVELSAYERQAFIRESAIAFDTSINDILSATKMLLKLTLNKFLNFYSRAKVDCFKNHPLNLRRIFGA